MSDVTTVILALISTAGGVFSAWMSGKARVHASTAAGAARYVAQSLKPPPQDIVDDEGRIVGRYDMLNERKGEHK
jgi:hypothetical protein